MLAASSRTTPISVKFPNLLNANEPVPATKFQSVVDALQYLTFTRLDIQFAVNQV